MSRLHTTILSATLLLITAACGGMEGDLDQHYGHQHQHALRCSDKILFNWGDQRFKYRVVAQGAEPGFAAPAADTSAFAAGMAPFGSASASCPMYANKVKTTWAPGTDLLLRRVLPRLPRAPLSPYGKLGSTGLTMGETRVHVVADRAVQVFFNGVALSPMKTTVGCADYKKALVFNVPAKLLYAQPNAVLAIRVRGGSATSFFDVKLTTRRCVPISKKKMTHKQIKQIKKIQQERQTKDEGKSFPGIVGVVGGGNGGGGGGGGDDTGSECVCTCSCCQNN